MQWVRKRKKPQHNDQLKDIVYVTALMNLIQAIIDLIKTLLE